MYIQTKAHPNEEVLLTLVYNLFGKEIHLLIFSFYAILFLLCDDRFFRKNLQTQN